MRFAPQRGRARARVAGFLLALGFAHPATACSGWRSAASDLVCGVEGDFRHLPSRDTALWLAGGSVASLIAHANDAEAADRLSHHHGADRFFEQGQWIGSDLFLVPSAALVWGIGRWTDRPRLAGTGLEMVRALFMSQVLTGGLKVATRRTRPDGTGYSFPSGHASASFATAAVLQRRCGWKTGVPAYGVATYVAASRMTKRRHWMSDVVAGATLGLISGRTVTRGPLGASLSVESLPTSGGTALLLRIPTR